MFAVGLVSSKRAFYVGETPETVVATTAISEVKVLRKVKALEVVEAIKDGKLHFSVLLLYVLLFEH
jgi:hypothetical protein